MKKKHITGLVISGIILILLILYLKKVLNNYVQYKNMKKSYIKKEKILSAYKYIKKTGNDSLNILDKVKKEIYRDKDIIEIFAMITELSDKSGVNLISFSPEKGSKNFKILIRGKYLKILKFIKKLEQGEYFLQITEFRIYLTDTQTGLVETDILCKLLK